MPTPAPKKVRIKAADRLKHHREYRRNRAKIKIRMKRYRKTAKFRRWLKRYKMKKAHGKTATGKRIRKYI